MITCHCNVITERDIEEVVIRLLREDPWQLAVPAMVYHELGKRGRCCSCFPAAIDVIVRTVEAFHRGKESPTVEVIAFTQKLRDKQPERERLRSADRARRLSRAG